MKVKNMFFAASLAALTVACGGQESTNSYEMDEMDAIEETMEVESEPNVVEIAVSSPDHTTLVAAVAAAGLVETLSGDGPFTIFAPTNAAFDALPAGTVEQLLLEENRDQLTAILTFHVVAGNVLSSDLSDGQVVPTLNGAELTVSIADGVVKINGAQVVAADLQGSNGVIHVINSVLIPN
jgi:uncharacterized surface protein with fasciclin (FAS1) repeats